MQIPERYRRVTIPKTLGRKFYFNVDYGPCVLGACALSWDLRAKGVSQGGDTADAPDQSPGDHAWESFQEATNIIEAPGFIVRANDNIDNPTLRADFAAWLLSGCGFEVIRAEFN